MAPFRAPEDWNGQGRDMSRPYRKTGYTVESEEDVMKYLALFGLFTIALACGGANEQPAPAIEEPAGLAEGPASVAAPDGVDIAYSVLGEGSPALVFIHGWMCDQTFWSAQDREFARTNTVVTIDLPGHGLSGMEREGWPLVAYGADVQAVVEHLGLDNVVLIGHSMGGAVVLEAARLMPDRMIGVVAVDSLHDAEFKYTAEQIEAFISAFENDFAGSCESVSDSWFAEGTDPELVQRVTDNLCDGSPEIGLALQRQFFEYEMGPALAAVRVPVRYINASGFPTNPEVNMKYQPDFSGVIVQDVGHFLMMERPEVFNELLRQVVADLG
jgi:pimeloyl-ACP methyl ester carboxylesterase